MLQVYEQSRFCWFPMSIDFFLSIRAIIRYFDSFTLFTTSYVITTFDCFLEKLLNFLLFLWLSAAVEPFSRVATCHETKMMM